MLRKALIFISLTVVVPFAIYSYYYIQQVREGYYAYDDFEFFEFSYGETSLNNSFNSKTGEYKVLADDSIYVFEVNYTEADKRELYEEMIKLPFFNLPDTIDIPDEDIENVNHLPMVRYKLYFGERTVEVLWDHDLATKNLKAQELRNLSTRLIEKLENNVK